MNMNARYVFIMRKFTYSSLDFYKLAEDKNAMNR